MTRRRLTGAAAGTLLALVGLTAAGPHVVSADTEYGVRQGDTLWGIAAWFHVSVNDIAHRNHIADPSLIYPGQRLAIHQPTPPAAAHASPAPTPELSRDQVRALLMAAAHRHGLNPAFLEAVAWWESGWRQSAVSPDGAIGIMQVMPKTGPWVGQTLLHRTVDIHQPQDNVEVGAALLSHYFDEFNGDYRKVLAAYYQGAWSVEHKGIYRSSHRYVDGIWALRNRIQAGKFDFGA